MIAKDLACEATQSSLKFVSKIHRQLRLTENIDQSDEYGQASRLHKVVTKSRSAIPPGDGTPDIETFKIKQNEITGCLSHKWES